MSTNRCLIVPTLVALGVLCAVATEHDASWDVVVQQLNSDSFYARRAAADQLIKTGSDPGFQSEGAIDALRRGLISQVVEIQLASAEILRTIRQINTDRQIEQLLNPHENPVEITLVGWQQSSKFLGTDMAARRIYAAIHQNHSARVWLLDPSTSPQQIRHEMIKIDPYLLAPEDSVQWTLLLLLETIHKNDYSLGASSRSCLSLSSPHLGPKPKSPQDSIVLNRLVDHWIGAHQDRCPTRECLLIAMKYGCRDRAKEICSGVFSDPIASPATLVMAMLCASAIGASDCETTIRSRLNDQRTAHIWQLIASRKTRIRTQVNDVALALLLHDREIDPRSVGFDELQADPLLTFQDYSLGFPDESSRESAHYRGLELLRLDN